MPMKEKHNLSARQIIFKHKGVDNPVPLTL